MRWIPFSERQPTPDEMCEGLWLANHERRALWRTENGSDRWNRLREVCTHWQPVTPPTDLPPKPLPQLSGGSDWDRKSVIPAILRGGVMYWLSTDRKSIVWERVSSNEEPASIPLADIDALKAVEK